MSKRVPTFILFPGFVLAKDGDKHYIDHLRLRELYRLNRWPHARIVVSYPGDRRATPQGWRFYPDSSGRYDVPKDLLKLYPPDSLAEARALLRRATNPE